MRSVHIPQNGTALPNVCYENKDLAEVGAEVAWWSTQTGLLRSHPVVRTSVTHWLELVPQRPRPIREIGNLGDLLFLDQAYKSLVGFLRYEFPSWVTDVTLCRVLKNFEIPRQGWTKVKGSDFHRLPSWTGKYLRGLSIGPILPFSISLMLLVCICGVSLVEEVQLGSLVSQKGQFARRIRLELLCSQEAKLQHLYWFKEGSRCVQSLFLSGECSRITYGVPTWSLLPRSALTLTWFEKEPRDLGMHELAVYTGQVQPCKPCRPIRRLIQRVLAQKAFPAPTAR